MVNHKYKGNSTYGAMKDVYNALYDPRSANNVCIFGQLLLTDLIERLEGHCELIQSNTDGLIVKLHGNEDEVRAICKEWEDRTGMGLGYDRMTKVVQKDVNNYIAVFADGKIEAKGAYVKELDDLDYDLAIVNEAVKGYLVYGYSVEDTILGCTELRKFQKVVKLSNKYKWVEHEQGRRGNLKYDNKAYRVFASRDYNDGRLLKCKPGDGVTVKRDDVTERALDIVCEHDNGGGWCTNKKCPHYNQRCKFYGDAETLKLCPQYEKVWYEKIVRRGTPYEVPNPVKRDKFANTPDHCFICNDDLNEMRIPDKLDKQYYIELAKKRIGDFGVRV